MTGYDHITFYKNQFGKLNAYVIFTEFGKRWAVTLDGKSDNEKEAMKHILERRLAIRRSFGKHGLEIYQSAYGPSSYMELTKENVENHNYYVSKYGGIPIDKSFINN